MQNMWKLEGDSGINYGHKNIRKVGKTRLKTLHNKNEREIEIRTLNILFNLRVESVLKSEKCKILWDFPFKMSNK